MAGPKAQRGEDQRDREAVKRVRPGARGVEQIEALERQGDRGEGEAIEQHMAGERLADPDRGHPPAQPNQRERRFAGGRRSEIE